MTQSQLDASDGVGCGRTRIAVTVLLDYLADGQRINDFLQQYPSVTHEQAVAAIEEVEQQGLQHNVG